MPKRRPPEERLAELIHEMGFERAEAVFRLLKSYVTKRESRERKKPVVIEAKAS